MIGACGLPFFCISQFLKMEFQPFSMRTKATGKLMRRKLYQNGILADALDHSPRNDKIITLSNAEKATGTVDDQGCNMSIILVKFKISGISKPGTVAQIDDLQLAQFGCCAPFHQKQSPFILSTKVYAKR